MLSSASDGGSSKNGACAGQLPAGILESVVARGAGACLVAMYSAPVRHTLGLC